MLRRGDRIRFEYDDDGVFFDARGTVISITHRLDEAHIEWDEGEQSNHDDDLPEYINIYDITETIPKNQWSGNDIKKREEGND